jgi:hypothetical protein
MKKMILVALVSLISGNAFALSANDSWNTIRAAKTVINQPQFAGAFGVDGLFNVCAAGDTFESIAPVKTCTAWKEVKKGSPGEEGEWTEYTCESFANVDVVISRNATETVCLDNRNSNDDSYTGCEKTGTVNVTYPLSYNLSVHSTEAGEAYQNYLFSKNLTIPACSK